MLLAIDGKEILTVPHRDRFKVIVKQLGVERPEQERSELNRLIDEMQHSTVKNRKEFNSSHLASSLSPWPHPLAHLYDVACEIEGDKSPDEVIENQAALYFGHFQHFRHETGA